MTDIAPIAYPDTKEKFYPETVPKAVTGLDNYINNMIAASGSSSGSLSGITMDAILAIVKQHLTASVDSTTGKLTLTSTEITETDIVSQIAAKVIENMKVSITDNDLVIEGGETDVNS